MASKKSTHKKGSITKKSSTTRSRKKSTARKPAKNKLNNITVRYCNEPEMPVRSLSPELDPNRVRLIRVNSDKWANGTKLHFYFFDQQSDGEHAVLSDGTSQWRSWVGSDAQKHIVRSAFDTWKNLGIGLDFEEVDAREDAEVRIGFMPGDGAWSYLGRHILTIAQNKRTMNFGWDISNDLDTALHEIGHTLGFPHEHQNPNAGIDWNEDAVYAALAAPPNNWSRATTHHNILRKIASDSVQGSSWDPQSIMHYPFQAQLIDAPPPYNTSGVNPPGGLSARDVTWVKNFYPPLTPQHDATLEAFESVELMISESEQANFVIEPEATRKYQIQTFGTSDTVMVLFEDVNGDLKYVSGDDDSGFELNAKINRRLYKGKRYVLRIRLYWADESGRTAVMYW